MTGKSNGLLIGGSRVRFPPGSPTFSPVKSGFMPLPAVLSDRRTSTSGQLWAVLSHRVWPQTGQPCPSVRPGCCPCRNPKWSSGWSAPAAPEPPLPTRRFRERLSRRCDADQPAGALSAPHHLEPCETPSTRSPDHAVARLPSRRQDRDRCTVGVQNAIPTTPIELLHPTRGLRRCRPRNT